MRFFQLFALFVFCFPKLILRLTFLACASWKDDPEKLFYALFLQYEQIEQQYTAMQTNSPYSMQARSQAFEKGGGRTFKNS